MAGIVQISFEGAYEDPAPYVTIYNARDLPAALYSQIQRYGLIGSAGRRVSLAGRLKGSRKAFTEMIYSYGLTMELVPIEV